MKDDGNSATEVKDGRGLGTVVAIIGAFIIGALVTANTSSLDINFIFYKAHDIPLWSYSLSIVIITIIIDHVFRFVVRRRKARKDKKGR